ncbi:MAG: TonB-dependent receptor plug domain-containing protein [bacterium]|nr:TonB-dependent receptor plug domain-containing protein [bacterium]
MPTASLLPTLLALIFVVFAPAVLLAQDDSATGEGETAAEDLYGPDDEDEENIEVFKVRAGEGEGAADFESGDSVQAFDAADLEALGAQSIADLASFTPNLEIVTSGATTPTFFIRGVGLNDFNANSTGAVAILFNDVPKNSPALQLGTLFDIEMVNVLKGPQGAGNYRSASAGAIKVYTKKPTGRYNAYLRQSYGNYDSIDLEGAVGGPIFEDIVAGRLAFRFSDRGGYGKNGCGDAPPKSQRGTRLTTSSGPPIDPEWSICGESVERDGTPDIDNPGEFHDGKSIIATGLPTKVNDQHNWAARGTLRFNPTLDQEWFFTASGGMRDELSQVGQSHGTDTPGASLVGPFGAIGRGVLGAPDGEAYVPKEVEIRRLELDPCKVDGKSFKAYNNPTTEPHCVRSTTPSTSDYLRYASGLARQLLASELAEKLDSKPHHGDYNRVGPTRLDTWAVSLKGDTVLADSIQLTTVTGYDHYDRYVSTDLDQSPNVAFEFETDDRGWQFAQTVDASGEVAEDVPISWALGGLFLYEELDVSQENFFNGLVALTAVSNRIYKQKLWSGGAHAGFTFTFWENFALDAGLRYNWERKSMNYTLITGGANDTALFARKSWQAPTGSLRLTFNFNETTYAFWKYTRGWKGGHFNATGGTDGVTNANPENVDSFEMGLHGVWGSGLLTLDLSVFHYNYKDYQIFTAEQKFSGLPEFVVKNASDAEVYGSEAEIVLRPSKFGPYEWQGLKLQANIGWLESQFLNYTQIQVVRREIGLNNTVTINNEIQNSGNPLLNSPRFKISLNAEQALPLGRVGKITFRWDAAWTDDTNFDATRSKGVPNFEGEQFLPNHTIGQEAYWIHNASVAYSTPAGDVEVTGWVRNLTDKAYKSFAFDVSALNKTTVYLLGAPRTFGVSLRTSF